jgi:hypothetical protein
MSQIRLLTYTVIIFSLISLSCLSPDIDKGEVNKLRPDINQNLNVNVDPNANNAKDNETELKSLVNLPFEPEENVYQEDNNKLTTDGTNKPTPETNVRKLTAVFKFSKDDSDALIKMLEEKGNGFESKIEPESWFPAELIAKSQMSGDESIKGTGYDASVFYKSPFNKGSITKINDTDYFVLILQNQ